ncbi:hypothetical protein [Cohnella cellulosilytica]|uniref:Alpha-L-rhamnosidase six-hairpin glycosidase domain-containing protein n=1 Tax=Cohnella cellulosilytica TaxID=986710 RepID=A0ABW2FHK7_9BACL
MTVTSAAVSARTIDFRYAPHSVWTAICRPDDPHKTVVDEKGRLLYEFRGGCFQRVIGFRLNTDREPLAIRQSTESARVPIVRTTVEYEQASIELLAFGHRDAQGRRADVVMWTIATREPSFMTHFQLQAQGFGSWTIRDEAAGGGMALSAESGADVPVRSVLSSVPLARGLADDYGPIPSFRTERFPVRPDAPVRGAVLIPLEPAEADFSDFDYAWAERALEEERKFWEGYMLSSLRLEVPDEAVMDMITSCARNIVQAREIHGGVPEFQVGPAVYRGLWVVDGHFLLEAAQYLGHAKEAFHGLEALVRRARPDGAIYTHAHHTKETGITLATFVRQCELMDDDAKLRELWPLIRKAVAYIEDLREKSKERGPDAPEYGLLPPAYGDGGLAGRRPEYTTPLWTLAGLKAIAGAAARLGLEEDAAAFAASCDSLMRAFREHAGRDMRSLADGTPYLPMLMPGSGSEYIGHPANTTDDYPGTPEHPWDRVNPATATWALAHAIYPGEVFDAEDPIVSNFCHLLELIDDEEEIPTGTGWAPYQAVWNYSASFYAHVWLYAGRPDKAIDYLYAFANHASGTRVWREEHPFRDTHHGHWVGDMPHNWASAEFIRLVRHLLVLERGARLELLAGLPEEWLVPGKAIVVERTPTRFGPVTLELHVAADGRTAELTFERDRSRVIQPEACLLHVEALKNGGIRELFVNGERVSLDEGNIRL